MKIKISEELEAKARDIQRALQNYDDWLKEEKEKERMEFYVGDIVWIKTLTGYVDKGEIEELSPNKECLRIKYSNGSYSDWHLIDSIIDYQSNPTS